MITMKDKRINGLIILLLMVFSLQAMAANEQRSYTFGVVPQQSATKLAKVWVPVLKNIEKQTGIKLRFTTAPNIPEFEKRVKAGQYDFSYMNPYHYTVFSKTPGYRAMAHARDKRIKGIMVVRKDSTATKLEELKDQKLAFPSPAAFAASILTRGEFSTRNIAIQPDYVSSHDSVYRSVAKGLYPAGGGVVRTFNAVNPLIHDQLKILWTTPGYTPHAIASHPDVSSDVVNKITEAFTAMDKTDAGKKLLNTLKVKGWQKASDAEWDDVRKLNIELL